jgi:hypothetical protein
MKPSYRLASGAVLPALVLLHQLGYRNAINTAEDVLQATQTSILADKPEGFVSPMSLP